MNTEEDSPSGRIQNYLSVCRLVWLVTPSGAEAVMAYAGSNPVTQTKKDLW